jgi:hypothetical protein
MLPEQKSAAAAPNATLLEMLHALVQASAA